MTRTRSYFFLSRVCHGATSNADHNSELIRKNTLASHFTHPFVSEFSLCCWLSFLSVTTPLQCTCTVHWKLKVSQQRKQSESYLSQHPVARLEHCHSVSRKVLISKYREPMQKLISLTRCLKVTECLKTGCFIFKHFRLGLVINVVPNNEGSEIRVKLRDNQSLRNVLVTKVNWVVVFSGLADLVYSSYYYFFLNHLYYYNHLCSSLP